MSVKQAECAVDKEIAEYDKSRKDMEGVDEQRARRRNKGVAL